MTAPHDLDPRLIRRLADMNAVYRMYGHSGELLYVGVSGHLRRFDNHAVKRWFPLVSRITLEWHQTEAAARVSERRAIQTERPRYNITDTRKDPRSRIEAGHPEKVRRLPASAAGSNAEPTPEPEPDHGPLPDALRVFGDDRGLHWVVLAARLADQIPSRWTETTAEVVSARLRSLGVPSLVVRYPTTKGGCTRRGCLRSDIEQVAVVQL